MEWTREPGSFRDPSGFVFSSGGVVYRQVNETYGAAYAQLIESGLYEELIAERLLVPHVEVDLRPPDAPPARAVLRPERIPFISYPYEWCFSQLKAAALLTLDLQQRALARGLILRDASAYNVQFVGARPIFIDTLSFGPYKEGVPWSAYRQFCQHFLVPLSLSALVDPALGATTRVHLDGVPLRVGTRLLPLSSRLRPGLLTHVHLHARSGDKQAGQPDTAPARPGAGRMSRTAMRGLVDSLTRTVSGLTLKRQRTRWSDYPEQSNYSESAHAHKQRLMAQFLDAARSQADIETVWDLGANTGVYSQIAADKAAAVVSFDMDHAAVERHFESCRKRGALNILPLVQDLTNPSGGIGWRNGERRSLEERGPADVALALALVHHLVITGGVPLEAVASFCGAVCRHLIVEFVPKEDSQVRRMLALRGDTFAGYSQVGFEAAFAPHFALLKSELIEDTRRTLYLMARR